MSMKTPGKFHKAADKKRRINRLRIKEAERARRRQLQAERDSKKAASKS